VLIDLLVDPDEHTVGDQVVDGVIAVGSSGLGRSIASKRSLKLRGRTPWSVGRRLRPAPRLGRTGLAAST
jgi:hypothetical protein